MKFPKIFLLCNIIFFLGCGELKPTSAVWASYEPFFSQGESTLSPGSDKLDPQCLNKSDFDACVVQKNPTSQKQGSTTLNDLLAINQFGVKLRGLERTTEGLRNSSLRIDTIRTPLINLYDKQLLKSQWSMQTSYLEQITAYYWMNRFLDYVGPRVGGLRIQGKGIRVVVDDAFNGWVPEKNSIHLKREIGRIPAALQSELAIYFLAQAEVTQIAGVFSLPSDDVTHKKCGIDIKGCCSAQAGCGKALRSSAGDYWAAVMFPAKARIGETISQNLQGQQLCGLSRDLSLLAQKSLAQTYSACGSQGRTGDVYVMGAFYAAVWWQIRSQAEGQFTNGAKSIDKFFHDHMAQWTSVDTLQTAKAKALSLSDGFEGGRFRALVENVFIERGF